MARKLWLMMGLSSWLVVGMVIWAVWRGIPLEPFPACLSEAQYRAWGTMWALSLMNGVGFAGYALYCWYKATED